jgi:hypothetical protein
MHGGSFNLANAPAFVRHNSHFENTEELWAPFHKMGATPLQLPRV